MRPLCKRSFCTLLSLLLLWQLIPPLRVAATKPAVQEAVTITQDIFPDSKFRQWLANPEHLNGYGADGIFTAEELSAIRKMDVSRQGIASLKGIEVFTSLEQLICGYNQLTQLDVRKNRSLTYLYCAFNRIEQLDLSGLHKLTALNCAGNTLTSLNLAGCTALEVVYCRNNRLTAVNFSDNTRLKLMDVFDNQLTRVDLSMLKDLEFAYLDHNFLIELDLSQNASLDPVHGGFTAQNNFLNTITLPVRADLLVAPRFYSEQNPKTGYERVEWYEDAQHSRPIKGSIQASGQTLYAKWLPNDYVIRFAANGGSGTMPDQAAVWDTPLALLPNQFSRYGYRFVGWENTYGNGKSYQDEQEVSNLAGKYQGERITLFAKWAPVTYTVAFDANGGNGAMNSQIYTYDQAAALPECTLTAPEGKEFAGWSSTAEGPVRYQDRGEVRNLTASQGETVTLYAIWRDPIENEYLGQLESVFSQYPADNYTAQDWNALVEIHSDAVEKISAAVNSDQMQAIVSQAGQAMSKIPTCDSRAQAVVNAWRSDHSMVLQQSGNQAVNEASAAEIYENALLAGSGITTSFTAEVHKDLTTPADQERITALALQVAEESLQSLSQLADAAAWADTLNGLSVRSLSEVTSSWQPTYEKAVQEAVPHTQNLTQELVESLRLRASLALEKQQAVAQLHMEYRSYDFNLYSDQGKRDLEEILHAGLSSIEAASTTGSIAGLLKKSQMDLQVIPDKVQEANPSPLPFADIKSDDWYYNAVLYVYKRKIMNGYSTTVFRPDRQISRAHLAQILYNLEGRPAVAGSISGYQDTVPGAWYEDAVTWAVQNNILSGYADGFMRPNRSITRQQLATMLYRYAQSRGYDVSQRAGLDSYEDSNQVASYAEDALQWATAVGIVNGTSSSMLSPAGNASRAQSAVILMRFCEKAIQ